jgi:putative membrane protein
MLALDRTRLANQRTILAFTVTAMHIMALGITFQTVVNLQHLSWLSWPLYGIAITIAAMGIWGYRKVSRDIYNAYQSVES